MEQRLAKVEGGLRVAEAEVVNLEKKVDKYDTKVNTFFEKFDIERKRIDQQEFKFEEFDKDLKAFDEACEKKFQFLKDKSKEKDDEIWKYIQAHEDKIIKREEEEKDKKIEEKKEKKAHKNQVILQWGGIILAALLTFIFS